MRDLFSDKTGTMDFVMICINDFVDINWLTKKKRSSSDLLTTFSAVRFPLLICIFCRLFNDHRPFVAEYMTNFTLPLTILMSHTSTINFPCVVNFKLFSLSSIIEFVRTLTATDMKLFKVYQVNMKQVKNSHERNQN